MVTTFRQHFEPGIFSSLSEIFLPLGRYLMHPFSTLSGAWSMKTTAAPWVPCNWMHQKREKFRLPRYFMNNHIMNEYSFTIIRVVKCQEKLKSDHSKTNRYQMVIDNYIRKDCEMTGDLGSKILFGRMNIYSFLTYSSQAPSDYIFIFPTWIWFDRIVRCVNTSFDRSIFGVWNHHQLNYRQFASSFFASRMIPIIRSG